MKMERVVLNALASFQPDNCAFGESSGIVFRPANLRSEKPIYVAAKPEPRCCR